jgi:hypothetical protein
MEPDFIIHNHEVLCKSHPLCSRYLDLWEEFHNIEDGDPLKWSKFLDIETVYGDLMTCKTCDHYINDDCYFSKSELKKIRFRVNLRRFRCELCGNPIHKMHNVLHKKLTESQANVEIPLICCFCHANMGSPDIKESFNEDLKVYLVASGAWLLGTIIFLILPFFLPFILGIFVFFIIMGLMSLYSSLVFFIKYVRLKVSMKKSKILSEFLT